MSMMIYGGYTVFAAARNGSGTMDGSGWTARAEGGAEQAALQPHWPDETHLEQSPGTIGSSSIAFAAAGVR